MILEHFCLNLLVRLQAISISVTQITQHFQAGSTSQSISISDSSDFCQPTMGIDLEDL